MPFHEKSTELVGHEFCFQPHCGNTWMLCVPGKILGDLETPEPFNLTLEDALFDGSEARVLICRLNKQISEHEFYWGALIARSDFFAELTKESVHCNLILSKARPTISSNHPYPDPSFVSANAEPYVRGFGVLSLTKPS